jgi:hypothetical protein
MIQIQINFNKQMSDIPHCKYSLNNFMTVSHEASNAFGKDLLSTDYDLVEDEANEISHPALARGGTYDHLRDRLSHLKTKLHSIHSHSNYDIVNKISSLESAGP